MFFNNPVITACILAWFIAQLLKVLFVLLSTKKMDFSRFVGSGGMPSSHSAFVVSLATAVGKIYGVESAYFAIAFVLAMVVMYDATNVRRAAGQQAKILNMMMEHYQDNDPEFMGKKLKELLGHTPFEVVVGALLGITVSLWVC
ncbi:MAG: divergent PAP2 family protein [Hyphomonadaceae bacterium]|nr:divergent PAP2 family protein [Clostridia bacterium]